MARRDRDDGFSAGAPRSSRRNDDDGGSRRSRRGRDAGANDSGGSPVKLILLIVGLVIGIPAVIAVLVLCVIFGMAFFAVKKTVEVGNEIAKNVEQDVERMNREAEAMRKQDAERRQQEALEKFKKKDIPNLPPPPKIGINTFDLLALIDPAQDKVQGDRWEIVNKGQQRELHCKEGGFVPRMQIPYLPPAEYDFVVSFSHARNLGNDVALIMPKANGTKSFFWYLGSDDGASYGFASQPNNIAGRMDKLLQLNRLHTTIVQVRRDGVRGYVDGKLLIDHKTNFNDLTCDNWREIRDTRLLAVACDSPTIFHAIQIKEVNGAGKRVR